MKDLKIEFLKGGGPGGQSVNKTESACRVGNLVKPSGHASSYRNPSLQPRAKRPGPEQKKSDRGSQGEAVQDRA